MNIEEQTLYLLEDGNIFLSQSYFDIEYYRNHRVCGYLVEVKDDMLIKESIYSVCKFNSDSKRKVKNKLRSIGNAEYILFFHSEWAIIYYLLKNKNNELLNLFHKKYKYYPTINQILSLRNDLYFTNILANLKRHSKYIDRFFKKGS